MLNGNFLRTSILCMHTAYLAVILEGFYYDLTWVARSWAGASKHDGIKLLRRKNL